MALRGHVFDKQLFSSDCYALVTDTFLGKQSGIIRGCDMTHTTSLIHINEGYFIVKGRPLQEEGGSNIEVEPGNIDGSYCKLVCELDMSKNNTTTELNQVSYKIIEDVTNYPVLMQEDITDTGIIYQFELAKFRRTLNGIEDFVDTRSFLNFDSIYEEVRNEIKKIEDGSIFVTEEEMREVGVVVSPTQPTTNEKVWIQKSNNLIKLDDSTITENGITFSAKDQVLHITGTATEYTQAFYIPFNDRKIVEHETLTAYFTGSGAIIKASYNYEGTVYYPNLDILKLPIGAVLYQVYFIIEKGTTVDMTVKLQLEKGDKSTEWKQAVDDGILTRNTNGNYEKLTLEKYSTGEQVIGTWIDGKPIYRKVFTGTSSTQENAVIQNYVGNVDTVVHAYGQLENSAGMKIALLSDTQSNVWDGNNFTVYVNNASSDTYKYKLIYEYTKSTD